jgi:hypothetical protein
LALHNDWHLYQQDISNVFFHNFLDDEVFIEQTKGFEDPNHLDFIGNSYKSLYCLKQSPWSWFLLLSQALVKLGFVGSNFYTSLYIFHTCNICLYMLIYIDGIIFVSYSSTTIQRLIHQLSIEFSIRI